MSEEKVAAVIPALDEGQTIQSVVAAVSKYVDEVVVVDDGSTDATSERAIEAGAVVHTHRTNQGYDRTIDDGFDIATGRGATIVVTLDADGQHNPEDIPNVLEPIRSGRADVVVGRRPAKARFSEMLYAAYTRARIGVADPLCGFKAYQTEVYREVGYFDTESTIGAQLMFEAIKRGFELKQVPIQLDKRDDQPRFGRRMEANWKILAALARLIRFDLTTISYPR